MRNGMLVGVGTDLLEIHFILDEAEAIPNEERKEEDTAVPDTALAR